MTRHRIPAPAAYSVATLAAHLATAWPASAVTDPGDLQGFLLVDLPPDATAAELDTHLAGYAHDPEAEALATATAAALAERARRLASTVTWAMPDTPVGPERDAWLAYRDELHALPSQPGWPLSAAWPAAPSPFYI